MIRGYRQGKSKEKINSMRFFELLLLWTMSISLFQVKDAFIIPAIVKRSTFTNLHKHKHKHKHTNTHRNDIQNDYTKHIKHIKHINHTNHTLLLTTTNSSMVEAYKDFGQWIQSK